LDGLSNKTEPKLHNSTTSGELGISKWGVTGKFWSVQYRLQ